MKNNLKFLFCGISLLIPGYVQAQCVENENCAALGYDSPTACDNGIKCPFGEYWACREPAKPEGAVFGQCTGYAKNCKIADILYSDGTCSADVVSGKTPVGVVVYIGGDGCGQALALEGLGSYQWSTEFVDVPDLINYSSVSTNDFSSCENTKVVIDYSYKQYGDSASEYYPAFWEAYNYTPSSMAETKGKWCLPSGGVLNSIYQNKAAIDQSLSRINKTNIGSDVWWSSSERTNSSAWYWLAFTGRFGSYGKYGNSHYVRPVIEF